MSFHASRFRLRQALCDPAKTLFADGTHALRQAGFFAVDETPPLTTFRRCVSLRRDTRSRLLLSRTFLCLAFAQLTYRESLGISKRASDPERQALSHGDPPPDFAQHLADANEVRDWRIYASFAQRLIAMLASSMSTSRSASISKRPSTLSMRRPSICACRSSRGLRFARRRPLSNCIPCSICGAISPPLSISATARCRGQHRRPVAAGGRRAM